MTEIVQAAPGVLFAVAAIFAAYAALDLGRRWIVAWTRDNARMDTLERDVHERLETFDKAIGIKAVAVKELGERVANLEAQQSTDQIARGYGRRRPIPTPEG